MTTNPKSIAFDAERRMLLCEIGVEWTSFDELYVDEAGDKWDMCRQCGKAEEAQR